MQLNTVVLPAPFGPIKAVMVPRPTSKLRSSMASRPPKRMVKCSTRSTVPPSPGISPFLAMAFLDQIGGDDFSLLQYDRRLACRDQAARPPNHDQHHGKPEQQHAVLGRIEGRPENILEKIKLTQNFGAAD